MTMSFSFSAERFKIKLNADVVNNVNNQQKSTENDDNNR